MISELRRRLFDTQAAIRAMFPLLKNDPAAARETIARLRWRESDLLLKIERIERERGRAA